MSLLALNRYWCFVQVGKRFDKSQSYSCARCLMASLGLVVTVEDVGEGIGGYSIARVGHMNEYPVVFLGLCGDIDAPLLGVLDGIGEQVVENGRDDL